MALTAAQQAKVNANKAKGGYNYNATPKPIIKPATSTTGVKPAPVVKPIGNNVFGDVSGASTALKNQNMGVVTANKGLQMKPEDMVYGAGATQKEAATPGYLQNRNDQLAGDFFNKGLKDEASITAELSKNAGFSAATLEEQKNTVQGIMNRMGSMQQPTDGTTQPDATVSGNPGQYLDANGNKVDILGYNDLPTDMKTLVDGMTDAEKKALDMQRGNDANGKLEYLRQAKRNQEYLAGQRENTIKINGLNGEVLQIQSSQRLNDAQKQVDNLIQNAMYLGDRGQPGSSSTRLQAAKQMITDAQQKFAQMKEIETKVAQIRELGINMDTAAYEKQMADISDDLNMKVGSQIQNAMNEMTSADLAGQLDTIDGVTQFKRSLLQKLDANITGYTEGSMKQMQYVTEQYQKIADDAQTRLTEWTKNANTVNTDMSTAKGMYVDGNGNPLYTSAGATIPMPQKPPMDPIYDKESGKLITFSNDASGKIVANVQQVTTEATQSQRQVNAVMEQYNAGAITADMAVKLLGKDAFAAALANPQTNTADTTTGYQGPEIAPVAEQEIQRGLAKYAAIPEGTKKGECGAFVNDYLESIGLDRMFIDPIDIRKTQTNSDTPTVGSIAVFQYPPDANVSEDAKKYGHVAIVTSVNADGSFNTVESNKNGDQKVFNRENISASQPVGFFDPAKGLKPTQDTGVDTNTGLDSATMVRIKKVVPNAQTDDIATAQGVADYTMDLTKVTSLKGGEREKISAIAKAIDPTFDMTKYPTRLKTQLAFSSSGKEGQQITAAETVINHMDEYQKLIKAQNNGDSQTVNKILNNFATEFGSPGTISLNIVANTVGDELAQFYNIGAQSGKEAKAEDFMSYLSGPQAEQGVQTQQTLMRSRLKNMNKAYKGDMGKDNERITTILNGGGTLQDIPAPTGPTDRSDIFN